MPPIKPRKQENSSQENENKTKVSGAKRIKHEIPKSKKEKENAPKPQDAAEVSCFCQESKTWVSEALICTPIDNSVNTEKPSHLCLSDSQSRGAIWLSDAEMQWDRR